MSVEAQYAPGTVPKDVEKYGTDVNVNAIQDGNEHTVHRALKARHLQMIAIGGTIGTGLFLGAGGAYGAGGPLGILLSYTVMGIVVYSMMAALGEMTTAYPVSGAFTHYAARFLDPAFATALGWNYWYSYAITLPTEISAATMVIDYWPHGASVSSGAWTAILIVAICSFNFLGVRYYGEAEFWFSIIKVITIVGLILLSIVITSGGTPAHDPIGFRYWKNPGPFQQLNGIPGAKGRFLAFWSTFVRSAFSYLGTEIVALTAGEAENPRRNVPKAIRRVFYRILFFYVFGVFCIGLIISPNDPDLGLDGTLASPWVIGIKRAGIKGLPSVINAVILTSAFSAGNSDLYASSRTLYGLAIDGKAPAIFKYVTKRGLPIWCLVVTALFAPLAFMTLSNTGSTVFNWLSNLSSITGLITWFTINVTYIRFHAGLKRQGISRDDFAYKAPFQPYFSYFGAFFIFLVVLFNGFTLFLSDSWSTSDFFCDYITVLIFFLIWLGWKIYKKTTVVSLDAMDFHTGKRELDQMADEQEANHKAPTSVVGKVWAAIM